MLSKVFNRKEKVALGKNCENQYFLIKLLLKIKNQGGGGRMPGLFFYTCFQFSARSIHRKSNL